MNFLRTLFWVLVTIVVVVFTMHNWQAVTIDLFGGLQADVKLPVLLLIAFLLGFVPLYVYYRARLWRERRVVPVVVPATSPAPLADPVIPQAPPAYGSTIPPAADTY